MLLAISGVCYLLAWATASRGRDHALELIAWSVTYAVALTLVCGLAASMVRSVRRNRAERSVMRNWESEHSSDKSEPREHQVPHQFNVIEGVSRKTW